MLSGYCRLQVLRPYLAFFADYLQNHSPTKALPFLPACTTPSRLTSQQLLYATRTEGEGARIYYVVFCQDLSTSLIASGLDFGLLEQVKKVE
jgi:hypothetical protein